MSFNGAGLFQVNTSGQPVVTGTTISSTVFNALTADLGTGLSTCILKDGTQATTARIPFAAGISSTLTTDATSTTTGSIITAGGISCVKALWVGGLANIAGVLTCQAAISATTVNATTGVLYLGGNSVNDVSLRTNAGGLLVRNGDSSAYADLNAKNIVVEDITCDDIGADDITCDVITAATVNVTTFALAAGGFAGSHGGGTYQSGILISVP